MGLIETPFMKVAAGTPPKQIASTPHESCAEYIAVCVPAFSPNTVHRDS